MVEFLLKTLTSTIYYIFKSRAFQFILEVIFRALYLVFDFIAAIVNIIARVIRYIVSAVTGPIRWWLDQITAN